MTGGRRARRPTPRPTARPPRVPPAPRPASSPRSSRHTSARGVAGDGVAVPRWPGSSPSAACVGPRGEPPPGHLAGQAQLVEPAGVVPGHPRRQQVALPLAGRRLDALELLDDREQAGPPLGPGPGGEVLPAGQEAHVGGHRDRLDPAPPAGPAGGVDPDQQVPGAPAPVGELDGRSVGLAAGQAGPGPGDGHRRAPDTVPDGRAAVVDQPLHGHRPGQVEVAAHALGQRLVGVDHGVGQRGVDELGLGPPLGGGPVAADRSRPARRPPARRTTAAMPAPPGTGPGRAAGRGARRRRAARDGPGRAPRPRPPGRRRPARPGGPAVRAGSPSGPSTPSPRGTATARVRRSSSGAPSRKVKGLPVRIPWARGEGSADSTKCTDTRPASTSARRATRPSASSGSVRQSSTVWRTSTWSGTATGPGGAFSWQAASAGQVAASMSSASIRWRWMGRRAPPREPGHDQGPVEVPPPAGGQHRVGQHGLDQDVVGGGALQHRGDLWSGGSCAAGPSESTTVSSSAAAWSSKSNETQNRLRRARPRARLIRPP